MIAAIYARRAPTNPASATSSARSRAKWSTPAPTPRARAGASLDEHVYVDDGISGAEFANRPGLPAPDERAEAAAAVSGARSCREESRLGREAIETAYALKQLVQAGVRVFFYLEDRERTLDSPTDKIMLSLTAFADELEREKARQRTYDAMQRKARAGHVTGGRVFGYDNVEILVADGQRSHVERRINEAEAAVVRRIFELCASGAGLTRIAKTPERGRRADAATAAGPTRGLGAEFGPRGAASAALSRRDRLEPDPEAEQLGTETADRPRRVEWLRVEAPELADRVGGTVAGGAIAIVGASAPSTTARWSLAIAAIPRICCLGSRDARLCGGGFASHVRTHGKHLARFYGCTSHWERGASICANGLVGRMEAIDAEVLATLQDDILTAGGYRACRGFGARGIGAGA